MATTYLRRNPSGNGNQRKFTFSFWIKKNSKNPASTYSLFDCGTSSNYFHIYFPDTHTLTVKSRVSNSTAMELVSTRVFRDSSAWYNIIVAVDSTQGTAANRCKIYVNGVQETAFNTANYGIQNLDHEIQDAGTYHVIGTNYAVNADEFFDGSMSYVAMVDGTQELPGIFGETDSTTGEWQIKTSITPSVAWGYNGFLILVNGNSVTDQSTNSNNFTVAAGTLTKTLDCPDNNFCTLNPLDKHSSITLAKGNTEYIATNGWYNVRGNFFVSSGKYYWEMKKTTSTSTYTFIGAATSEPALDFGYGGAQNGLFAYSASDGNKIGQGTASTSYGASFATGDIMGIALDMDGGTITFYKNGASQGQAFSGITGDVAPWITGYNNKNEYNFGNGYFGTTAVTTNSGNGYAGTDGKSIFYYQPPTGYSALTTTGLNV